MRTKMTRHQRPEVKKALEVIASAMNYDGGWRTSIFRDGVIVADVDNGGGMIIHVQFLEPPVQPIKVEDLYPPAAPKTATADDDIPF